MAIGSDSYTWHGNININIRERTIYIEQMPTYLAFKKSTFCAGIRISNRLPCSLTVLNDDKEKFKTT
jgi:hypothetical protein